MSSNIMTAEHENPFRLPPDEMVFLKREEQQAAAKAERDEQKSQWCGRKPRTSQSVYRFSRQQRAGWRSHRPIEAGIGSK